MADRVPVICDRCQAQGLAGEADFAGLGDLLDFAPVPHQIERVDGWNPECQRAFIAAVSILGSSDRAARAIGKSATGAEQLRRRPGAEGFSRAWDRAKAIAQERGTLRLAHSLRTAKAAEPPLATRPGPPPPGPGDEAEEVELSEREERQRMLALGRFFRHYLSRLELERRARLAGKIVEADFYVRQVTFIEVMIDLVSGDGWDWLVKARFGDVPHAQRVYLVEIAETTMSRLLDEMRREYWAEGGEPERPPLPSEDQLFDRGRFKTGASEAFTGPMPFQEAFRAREAGYAEAARAQIEWEEKARREAAEWRARLAKEAAEDPPRDGDGDGERAGGAGPEVGPAPQPDDGHRPEAGGGEGER